MQLRIDRECTFIGCEDGNTNAVYLVSEVGANRMPVCKEHFDLYYKPFPDTYDYVELIPSDESNNEPDGRQSEDMVDTMPEINIAPDINRISLPSGEQIFF